MTQIVRPRNIRLRAAIAVAAGVVLVAGCSSDSDPQVATISGGDTQPEASASPSSSSDGGLAFASCMRDNGIDVPDPDPDGGFDQRGEADIDIEDPKFRTALDDCRDLLPADNPLTRNFNSAQQSAILKLVSCLRKNGVDVPDPQFDANGKLVIDNPGALNPSDPKVREALQECRSEITAVAPGNSS